MDNRVDFDFKSFSEKLKADFTEIMITGLKDFEDQALDSLFNESGIKKAVKVFQKRFDKSLCVGVDKLEKLFRVN